MLTPPSTDPPIVVTRECPTRGLVHAERLASRFATKSVLQSTERQLFNGDPGPSRARTIVDRDSAPHGAVFRRAVSGPERELVEHFIPVMPLVHATDSCVTVLREPGLESGFPDLVIVVWRDARTAAWSDARFALVPSDLQLMHYIFQRRRTTSLELERQFGARFARRSIDRLHCAGLVRARGHAWFPCAIDRIFAATKIIAIEAKIGKWKDALNQARLNTWFASKSYVLVPRVTEKQVAEAQCLGVGVLAPKNGGIAEWEAATFPLPRSHASWLVNDLAWRASKPWGIEQHANPSAGRPGLARKSAT